MAIAHKDLDILPRIAQKDNLYIGFLWWKKLQKQPIFDFQHTKNAYFSFI
jgi:hypothetical protein